MNKEIDKIMKYFTKLADTYTVKDLEPSRKTNYDDGVQKSRTMPSGESGLGVEDGVGVLVGISVESTSPGILTVILARSEELSS